MLLWLMIIDWSHWSYHFSYFLFLLTRAVHISKIYLIVAGQCTSRTFFFHKTFTLWHLYSSLFGSNPEPTGIVENFEICIWSSWYFGWLLVESSWLLTCFSMLTFLLLLTAFSWDLSWGWMTSNWILLVPCWVLVEANPPGGLTWSLSCFFGKFTIFFFLYTETIVKRHFHYTP